MISSLSTKIQAVCDYIHVYIVFKGTITIEGDDDNKKRNKKIALKNNTPFGSCILKMNNIFINNAQDHDVAMSMYSLLEYSENYSMTSGGLWNYYGDEINDDAIKNVNNRINNNKTIKC